VNADGTGATNLSDHPPTTGGRTEFCRLLASEGFLVVRFDNRDAGRSTHLPGRRYTLEDMAGDAVGLLDVLRIDSAHVVGASLGGMIAQLMAIRHPDRVRSLASLMSTTGRRGTGRTFLLILRHAVGRRPRTEAEAIERRVQVFRAIGSTGSTRIPRRSGGSARSPSGGIPMTGRAGAVSTAPCAPPATGRRACSGSLCPRS
jgi:pimeloyl-ACP methyl ester carboxylesterase